MNSSNSTIPDIRETIREALEFVDPDMGREDWVRVLMSIKSELGDDGEEIALDWSERGDSFDPRAFESTWRSISEQGSVTLGTLVYHAKAGGWKDAHRLAARRGNAFDPNYRPRARAKSEPQAPTATQIKVAKETQRRWSIAKPADPKFPYLVDKGIGPGRLRQESVIFDRYILLVPLYDSKGFLWSTLKINPEGAKLFDRGSKVSGCYSPVGEYDPDKPLYICEGIATAHSIEEMTGCPVAAAMSAGNMMPVALALRELFPKQTFIIAADNDRGTTGNPGLTAAKAVASEVPNCRLAIPEFPPGASGTDFNDLHQLKLKEAN